MPPTGWKAVLNVTKKKTLKVPTGADLRWYVKNVYTERFKKLALILAGLFSLAESFQLVRARLAALGVLSARV